MRARLRLGAEIKDSKKWQDLFKGKELFANGDRDHVALSVEKKVTDPKTQVDCVTGATITSNGVADMLKAEKGGLQPMLNSLMLSKKRRLYSVNKTKRL